MATSSSSPPARSIVSPKLYDVFISHRGPDVKETLAKQLYDLLKARDCKAFLDREEIEGGDSIPFAIENGILSSRVQIAIFSKGYAESSWCLDELVLMLKQKDAFFIPVFYDVQPQDIRRTENKKSQYAAAFSGYRNKGRNLDKLDEWKQALASAADRYGYERSNHQDNLCEKIVSRVVQIIQEKINLPVAKYPVGLDELVQDFERWFSKTTGTVGIFGLGGSGKSTLSKELYNRKRSGYHKSCFLSDVRESHARGELHRLQSQLLKDLFNKDQEDQEISSVDHGIGELKGHLTRAKHLHFFIVLDDIDQQYQLDALLPEGMLGSGCMVIITTRDQSVLRGADFHYKMKGMNKNYAMKLFCSHAFRGSDTPAAYEKLVKGFVSFCGGLPLSLIVLGAHVYGRNENYWELELEKVKKIQPKYIMQRLKISFDGLDREEKQIFIDIACLFNKIDFYNLKSKAIIIWNASGWSAEHALQTLQDKCLVEAFGERFEMHAHLRDLGRQMAEELGPPRLWQPGLLRSMETKILAETKGRCFHSFKDSSLGRQITFFLSATDLLWLEIPYFLAATDRLSMSIPSWIPPRKLHILAFWGVEELWSSFQQQLQINPQSPLRLRELRISQCFGVRSVPEDLCDVQSLEHLQFTSCPMLSSLPPRFGDLRNLRYLDLSDCEQLEELPLSFEKLIRLKYIRLSCCCKLKLRFDMLENITQLEYLELTRCRELKVLPRLVTPLRELRINQCFQGSSLPEELCDLKSLEHLELSCCPMLSSLPSRFGKLRNLRYLDLSYCWKLKLRSDMLENITNLDYLNLTRCHEVEELPHNISYQANLKRLFVEGTSINYLPTNIGELHNLEELKIGSPMLTSLPPSLGELTCLDTLVIDGCVQLQDLPQSLCNLDLLKQLKIRGSGLRERPFGVGSSNIEITGQQVEASNSGFNSRERVTENCRQTIWNAFKRIAENCLKAIWNALKHLLINKRRITEHGSPQTHVQHVHNKIPAGVETLSLVANPQLMEIQVLPESLKILEIYACKMLRKISGVGHLLELRRLEICSCPDLSELPSFAGLTSLQEFKIQGCPKVEIVQGLEFSKSLQILTADVSLIRSLESAEELRRVELTSYTMSDLKSCILSMKKCPREAMIRATVGSIVQSLPLTDLSVLRLEKDSDWDDITQDLFNEPFLWYQEENEISNEESGSSGAKVVQIGVCREGSSAFPEYCVRRRRIGSNRKDKKCKAVLARGDDENVVAAFNQLIRLLE